MTLDLEMFTGSQPPAPVLPPHITCTYGGFFYQSGPRGNDKIPFNEEVKVPLTLVRHPKRSAGGVFRDIIGQKVMTKFPGFNGFWRVFLNSASALPDDFPLHKQLDWTGSFNDLAKFAKVHAREVIPGLYHNSSELRHAIRVCMLDPVGFAHQQGQGAPNREEEQTIAAELLALGYE